MQPPLRPRTQRPRLHAAAPADAHQRRALPLQDSTFEKHPISKDRQVCSLAQCVDDDIALDRQVLEPSRVEPVVAA